MPLTTPVAPPTSLLAAPAAALDTESLIELGVAAERRGARREAREHYERAIRAARVTHEARRVPEIMTWIARTLGTDGDVEAALDCLEVAVATAEALGNELALGRALNARAASSMLRGDLRAAESLLLQARAAALRVGDSRLVLLATVNLACAATHQGDLVAGRRYLEQCAEGTADPGMADLRALVYIGRGQLATEERDWEAADHAFAQAATALEHILSGGALVPSADVEASLHVAIAESMLARGTETAITREAVSRGLLSAQRAGVRALECEAHRLAGVLALRTDRLLDAALDLAAAERIAQHADLTFRLADIRLAQADLARRRGQRAAALRLAAEGHALLQRRGARPIRSSSGTAGSTADAERLMLQIASEWRRAAVVDPWAGAVPPSQVPSDSTRAESPARIQARSASATPWGATGGLPDEDGTARLQLATNLVDALAESFGIAGGDRFWWRLGTLLRDIGMTTVPEAVRWKPEPLSEAEWALVSEHPDAGIRLLEGSIEHEVVRAMIGAHHERWDGAGYPRGISEDAIPLPARVLAVVDAYCALIEPRAYRGASSHEAALEQLRREVGLAFDPNVFARFESLVWDGPRDSTTSATAPSPDAVADVDDLTRLMRRGTFGGFVATELEAAAATGRETSLLVVDLDHFKLVNDTFGHLQGDDVLQLVADAMRDTLGDAVLCRYAGDEFVALLPSSNLIAGCGAAERLRAAVASRTCPRRDDPTATVGITVSIGVATAPLHGTTLEALFGAADGALYGAKRRGRNAVTPAARSAQAKASDVVLDVVVGHPAERRWLEEQLAAAAQGQLRIAAIYGARGSGRGTLVRQLAPAMAVRGGVFVSGAAMAGNPRSPLSAWTDVVRALHIQGLVSARPWRVLHRITGLASSSMGSAPPGPEQSAPLVDEEYASLLIEEVAQCLLDAAATRPVLVLLEDVHLAGAALLHVLEVLARWHADERLLICVTADEGQLSPQVGATIASVTREEVRRLGPLEERDVRQWLTRGFNGRLVGDALASDLLAWSAGSPGTIRALLQLLLRSECVRFHQGAWQYTRPSNVPLPESVASGLRERLGRLSDRALRELTQVAEAWGECWPPSEAAQCAPMQDETLQECLAAGVLRWQAGPSSHARGGEIRPAAGEPAASGTWCLAHPLLREVVRRSAPPAHP